MNSERGVTLTSLIIYVIVMCIVVGMISTITGSFYSSAEDIAITNKTADEYSRFLVYIVGDINSRKYK